MRIAETPFGRIVHEIDSRARGKSDDLVLMSVSLSRGLIPRSELTDKEPRADDLSIYKRCWQGDVVLNRMSAYQGALGLAHMDGMVSPDYAVLRAHASLDARFLTYLMKSNWFISEMTSRLRGIGSPGATSVRTPRVNIDDLRDISIALPPIEEQRRIADFLDDQVTRIDQAILAREAQSSLLNQLFVKEVIEAVGGVGNDGDIMPMTKQWLSALPESWTVRPIGSVYEVRLGKMLNQDRAIGDHVAPYLRNANVQWDWIETDDLEEMNFPPEDKDRFEVIPGDLLICEGGQPGRAAIWEGSVSPIYYQKALHRARLRGHGEPRWLMYCLRAAVESNYFVAFNSTTTIAHLTGEQLLATRFPFPPVDVQITVVKYLDSLRASTKAVQYSLSSSIRLLTERKRALITSAVTGRIDVTNARSIKSAHASTVGVGAERRYEQRDG